MRTITVYSKPNCPACRMIKRRFTDLNVSFNEISLKDDNDIKEFHKDYPLINKLPFTVVMEDGQIKDTWTDFNVTKVNKYGK